jgi:hypothetical protein
VEIDRLLYYVRTVAAGNVRAGIYREGATPYSPVGGALIAESGSVAMAAATTIQVLTIPDTILEPGNYWCGVQGDDVTGEFWAASTYDDIGVRRSGWYDHPYGAFTDPCPPINSHAEGPWFELRIKRNLV